MESSWDHRNIFASRRHVQGPEHKAVLFAARLMRFSATDSSNTGLPGLFYVNSGDFDTLWISVSAPDFGLETAEKKIVIRRPCD
jgi:hypothetical protein